MNRTKIPEQLQVIINIDHEVALTIEYLMSALELSEDGVKKEISKNKKKIKAIPKKKDDKRFIEISRLKKEYHEEKKEQLEEFVLNIIRNSLFLMSYSLLEKTLFEICELFHKQILVWPQDSAISTISPSKIRGEGLLRFTTYLQEIVHLDLPSSLNSYALLLTSLRNSFAHSMGTVDSKTKSTLIRISNKLNKKRKDALTDFTFKVSQLTNERFDVILGPQFVKCVLLQLHIMLLQLLTSLYETYGEYD